LADAQAPRNAPVQTESKPCITMIKQDKNELEHCA
jgi:hypothetical protein